MEENPQSVRAGGGDGGARRIAVDVEDSQPHSHRMLPVWFFVGIILLIYGLIILGTGIFEFSTPPPTVLADKHPALWWGALLTVIGGTYVSSYWPK